MGIPAFEERLSELNACRKVLENQNESPIQHEEARKNSIRIISTLYGDLRDADVDVVTCNRVYEVIQPFEKLDMQEHGLQRIIQIFSTVVYGSPVQNLKSFLGEKRIQDTTRLFQEEQARAIQEHQEWIQNVIDSDDEAPNQDTIRAYITELRNTSPRLIINVEDEVRLLQNQVEEKISRSDSPATIQKLNSILAQLEDPLFKVDQSLEKLRAQGGADVVVLKPNPEVLSEMAIERLKIRRLYRLENLEAIYEQSVNKPNQQVASKYFEKTAAWYVGNFFRTSYSPLHLEMQDLAEKHGIKVISDVRQEPEAGMKTTGFILDNKPVPNQNLGAFPQDFVDFSRNGEIRIPVMRYTEDSMVLFSSMELDRKKRSPDWRKIIDECEGSNQLLYLGAPFDQKQSLKALVLASSLNIDPLMNLTYNEGGNTLIGKRNGQPYVLIGLDSYIASKVLMERDLGREITRDEVVMAFAIDYGVSKESVHFIEQPGDFHLDMSMAIIGDNTILLNDAEAAQAKFASEQQARVKEMGDERPELRFLFESYLNQEIKQAPIRKKMEDVAEQDLRALGFNVVRVPGRFNYTSRLPAMNLFNMVTAETPDGQNIIIMLGCVGEYAEYFEKIIRENCDRTIDAIYFLDSKNSQDCLLFGGGISCRTKTIPR